MNIDDPALIQEFVVESQEHLASVESQLLSLEDCVGEIDCATVNKVFRAVHSIKGAAGFLGLTTLENLSHRSEEVLNQLRNNEMRPTKTVIDTLLQATDRLKTLLDSIEASNNEDVSQLIASLENLMTQKSFAVPPLVESEHASSNFMTEVDTRTVRQDETHVEIQNEKAIKEFLIESLEALENIERDLFALEKGGDSAALINNVFRNVHTIKGTAGFLAFSKVEQLSHQGESALSVLRSSPYLYSSEVASATFRLVDEIKKHLAEIEINGKECDGSQQPVTSELLALVEKLKSMEVVEPANACDGEDNARVEQVPSVGSLASDAIKADETALVTNTTPNKSLADSSIRVDVSLLDNLMTCVGELVLARNQILQYSTKIASPELAATSQRLNIITSELQEGVMKTRMQQIGTAWSRFPRMVRDLAASCGKEVRVEMEGKETELDKTIIEAIKDPLTHLVRNTVDHGIEKPGVRQAQGKPVEGCLSLRAYHEGGQVNIEISDDGGGLNIDRIKQKAIDKGIVTMDQASRMNSREISQLIFLPGFSTAETISNVSGRGVGMDVVKTNIEKIGGTIDLASVSGKGTTMRIKIPLTLAIIPALIVSVDSNRFAIPQVNVVELVCLDGDEATKSIENLQGSSVYRLRGRLLPVVQMRKILGLGSSTAGNGSATNIVVLRADDCQFGLVVDRICDTQEIVVKPLSTQLSDVSVYAGATIMGDGKVALILDVLGLAQTAHASSKDRSRSVSDGSVKSTDESSATQTLLILGTSAGNRLALPISQVARLEKLPISAIEQTDNQEVVQYRKAILPLVRLASTVGLLDDSRPVDGLMNTVVYMENGRSYGLVVDRIIDTVETVVEVSRPSMRRGMLGSAIIHGHVTDLIDLPAVIELIESNNYAHS